jgi:ABC-type multidrug transport system permease subunit
MNRLLRLSRALQIAVSNWWEDRGDSVIGTVGTAAALFSAILVAGLLMTPFASDLPLIGRGVLLLSLLAVGIGFPLVIFALVSDAYNAISKAWDEAGE